MYLCSKKKLDGVLTFWSLTQNKSNMLISGRIFFHFAIFLSTLPGLDEPAEAEEEVGEDEQQGKKTKVY